MMNEEESIIESRVIVDSIILDLLSKVSTLTSTSLWVRQRFLQWWKDIERYGFNNNNNDNGNDDDNDDNVSTVSKEEYKGFLALEPLVRDVRDSDNRLLEGEQAVEVNDHHCSGFWRRGRRHCNVIGSTSNSSMLSDYDIELIVGRHKNGFIEGPGQIFMRNNRILKGNFIHGALQGFVRGFENGNLIFVCDKFNKGRIDRDAICYRKMEGQGFLLSKGVNIDSKLQFNNWQNNEECNENYNDLSNKIAFIHNDFNTALVGLFRDDYTMIRAKYCDIVDFRLNDNAMPVPIFCCNESYKNQNFGLCVSTSRVISCPMLVPDPLESKYVFVANSSIFSAGQGLFARRNLQPGLIIAFYNGLRYENDAKVDKSCNNKDDNDNNECSSTYEISLDWPHYSEKGCQSYMDLPFELGSSLDLYRATLGHKINHCFRPNCKWTTIWHPCFGRIPAIATLVRVDRNDELTCHYGFDMDAVANDERFQWYFDAWN